MRKIWTVAWTEYLNAVRSKAFIIGLLALPVMMFGGLIVGHIAKDKVDIRPRRLAVLDQSGIFLPLLETKAAERNANELFASTNRTKQIRPAFEIEAVSTNTAFDEALELTLSDRVRRKELFAFLVIRPDATAIGATNAVSYFTETASYEELPRWLNRVIGDEVKRLRFEAAGVDRVLVQRLTTPVEIRELGLTKRDASGKIQGAKETNRAATILVPMATVILLFMLVMSSAPALLNSVLEEKMQKIAEVLVASVSPFQLMMGKLVGAVLVSLTLSVLYLGSTGWMLAKFGLFSEVDPALFAWFLLFQMIALLTFGSIFLAVGSACSEIRDAQSLMFPAMMLVMLPMFCLGPVLQSPSSSFSRALSLFPPATPTIMTLRIASKPAPPLWEILLGAGLAVAFMLLCVWAAGKIFRIGLLSQGQAPTFGRMLKWIVSK